MMKQFGFNRLMSQFQAGWSRCLRFRIVVFLTLTREVLLLRVSLLMKFYHETHKNKSHLKPIIQRYTFCVTYCINRPY